MKLEQLEYLASLLVKTAEPYPMLRKTGSALSLVTDTKVNPLSVVKGKMESMARAPMPNVGVVQDTRTALTHPMSPPAAVNSKVQSAGAGAAAAPNPPKASLSPAVTPGGAQKPGKNVVS